MVSEPVAPQEQALKGLVSLPGKPGKNAGGKHASTLTPRVPVGSGQINTLSHLKLALLCFV